MKKTLLFKSIALGLFMLFGIGVVSAQNLLPNGDMESWTDATTPTNWSHIENITQESTIVHGGTYSAQHIGGTKDLGQTIVVEPNTYYTIVIWYYVAAGDGSDARIWSFFKDASDVRLADIPALLGPDNSYFTSDASWQKYETTVVSPADAASLYFEVRTYSGATVYWDDMSVTKVAAPPLEVTFNVDMNNVTAFTPGTDVLYIAGDIAGGWAGPGSDPAYEMTDTDSDGIYTITLIKDPAGDIAYKYFINAGWDGGEWPGGDDRTASITETTILNDVFGKNIYNAAITEVGPYNAGDDVTITWSSVGVSDVTIDVWASDDNEWYKMFETTPSDGSEVFTIPADAESGSAYYLRISDLTDSTNVFGISSTFEVIGTPQATAISQVFITEIADPNNDAGLRFIELYNSGSTDVDFTEGSGWRIDKYTNASSTVSQTLALTGIIPAGGYYIIATGAVDGDFLSAYGIDANQFDGADNDVAGSNGDDNLELYNGLDELVDQFGVPGEDGTGTDHEFEDGRAERVATVTQSNPVWDLAEWNIDSDAPSGDGPQDAPDAFDPGAWIGHSTTGLNSPFAPEMSIYPNPSNGKFFVQMGSTFKANTKIEVFNVIGMKVFETIINNFKTEINLSSMKQGVYYVRVDDGKNITTQKVIKQ